jgi:hypothetical protein
MSGPRHLLDTNAVIALLRGHAGLLQELRGADWIGVSVITRLELLSFSQLGPRDGETILVFLHRVAVIGLDPKAERYLDRITAIRAATGIKLPDAIIAATVVEHDASLVTADRQLLDLAQQVAELRVFAVPPSG